VLDGLHGDILTEVGRWPPTVQKCCEFDRAVPVPSHSSTMKLWMGTQGSWLFHGRATGQ
jgi:hypothetical protein